MPRENRKRGKKHKKNAAEEPSYVPQAALVVDEEPEEEQGGPSWIVPARKDENQIDTDAPFGYVNADIKAYFRTVDTQLKDWQENGGEVAEEDGDVDPNENRRIFLMAALQEMTGKERELATDPECASVLERMAYSMDDFVRRVFVDSLTGSYEQLVKHRFASHVIQTLLTVASDTVSRESRDVFPSVEGSADKGELLTLTQLILDLVEELLPSFSSLVLDQFASHVVRALLVLLSPNLFPSSSSSSHKSPSVVRSKKSAAWKEKQGPLKSIFQDSRDKGKAVAEKENAEPHGFRDAARKIVLAVRQDLGANEVRSLAAHKVASPVLQMLLEIEDEQGLADEPDSLMDHILVGLITLHHTEPTTSPEPSDFLNTLLRDPTSSHLLETLVSRAPEPVFDLLWSTYFENKLPKLALHPVANFVVAKAFGRVNVAQMEGAIGELDASWGKLVHNTRTGVLRALVDRAASLGVFENEVCKAVYAAFALSEPDDRKFLVQCVLSLQSLQGYKDALAAAEKRKTAEAEDAGTANMPPKSRFRKHNPNEDPLDPKTPGAILLQSLLHLPQPHNDIVLRSIQAMSVGEVTALAQHSTSSRVLDVLLDSPAVPAKSKRAFVLSLIGHYHILVDDRIGSRVGDRCWVTADPYLKEKVARSLIPHETHLAGSFYGKFFARNLNLYLLQRRPEEWRSMQVSKELSRAAPAPAPQAQVASDMPAPTPKRKRKHEAAGGGDEIDELFDQALGRRAKKGSLAVEDAAAAVVPSPPAFLAQEKWKKKSKDSAIVDGGLVAVLGAIQSAPKGDVRGRKKHKH